LLLLGEVLHDVLLLRGYAIEKLAVVEVEMGSLSDVIEGGFLDEGEADKAELVDKHLFELLEDHLGVCFLSHFLHVFLCVLDISFLQVPLLDRYCLLFLFPLGLRDRLELLCTFQLLTFEDLCIVWVDEFAIGVILSVLFEAVELVGPYLFKFVHLVAVSLLSHLADHQTTSFVVHHNLSARIGLHVDDEIGLEVLHHREYNLPHHLQDLKGEGGLSSAVGELRQIEGVKVLIGAIPGVDRHEGVFRFFVNFDVLQILDGLLGFPVDEDLLAGLEELVVGVILGVVKPDKCHSGQVAEETHLLAGVVDRLSLEEVVVEELQEYYGENVDVQAFEV
jgi:hypothetical protein